MSATALLNIFSRVPIPIFGNARTGTIYLAQKAKVLPKLAPWAIPGLIGAVWFVWPAVTDGAKIMLGLIPDPEEVELAALEAADKAAAAASAVPKEEIQEAIVKAMTPSPEQLKLAAREERGDFSHMEADWEKRINSALKFEDDDDEEDEDDDDDDDDEEEGGEEEEEEEDDDDDDDE